MSLSLRRRQPRRSSRWLAPVFSSRRRCCSAPTRCASRRWTSSAAARGGAGSAARAAAVAEKEAVLQLMSRADAAATRTARGATGSADAKSRRRSPRRRGAASSPNVAPSCQRPSPNRSSDLPQHDRGRSADCGLTLARSLALDRSLSVALLALHLLPQAVDPLHPLHPLHLLPQAVDPSSPATHCTSPGSLERKLRPPPRFARARPSCC